MKKYTKWSKSKCYLHTSEYGGVKKGPLEKLHDEEEKE